MQVMNVITPGWKLSQKESGVGFDEYLVAYLCSNRHSCRKKESIWFDSGIGSAFFWYHDMIMVEKSASL